MWTNSASKLQCNFLSFVTKPFHGIFHETDQQIQTVRNNGCPPIFEAKWRALKLSIRWAGLLWMEPNKPEIEPWRIFYFASGSSEKDNSPLQSRFRATPHPFLWNVPINPKRTKEIQNCQELKLFAKPFSASWLQKFAGKYQNTEIEQLDLGELSSTKQCLNFFFFFCLFQASIFRLHSPALCIHPGLQGDSVCDYFPCNPLWSPKFKTSKMVKEKTSLHLLLCKNLLWFFFFAFSSASEHRRLRNTFFCNCCLKFKHCWTQNERNVQYPYTVNQLQLSWFF